MVVRVSADTPDNGSEAYFEKLQETWPAERPSRRKKRAYNRKADRRILVRAERLDQPDPVRLSRALIQAQRELAAAQAEAEALKQTRLGEHSEPEDHREPDALDQEDS